MAREDRVSQIKASINEELEGYLVRLRDAYRPDLKDEAHQDGFIGDLLFPPLKQFNFQPLSFPITKYSGYFQELKCKEVEVADLLTMQLSEDVDEVPRRLLVVGLPEAGKTALFAAILHAWLHDKSKVQGLAKLDLLIAFQCLALPTLLESSSTQGSTPRSLNLLKELLTMLSRTVLKFGEEEVTQYLSSQNTKIIILIDSLDTLNGFIIDEEFSLSPWKKHRAIILSDIQFLREKNHPLRYEQDADHLVLQLTGGFSTSTESGMTGSVFTNYCKRICETNNVIYDEFKDHLLHLMKTLSTELRKPYNTYLALKLYKSGKNIQAKTVSELYNHWLEYHKQIYQSKLRQSDTDSRIMNGVNHITNLAREYFHNDISQFENETILSNKCTDFQEMRHFFANILMPHYTASGFLHSFTFRLKKHEQFLVAKGIIKKLNNFDVQIDDLMPKSKLARYQPIIPLALGLSSKGLLGFDKVKAFASECIKIFQENDQSEDSVNPIVNYHINILGESNLYEKLNDQYDDFVHYIVSHMNTESWCVTDGNHVPGAVKALCEQGHVSHEDADTRPGKIIFKFNTNTSENPGLVALLGSVKECDIRVSLIVNQSFIGKDEATQDVIIRAMQIKSKASLEKFCGCLNNISYLDNHPTTRRASSLSLRIDETSQYESLHTYAKRCAKLIQVSLRIPNPDVLIVKKLKELPSSVMHLTVNIESVNDGSIGTAIAIWRAIRGNTRRKNGELLQFRNNAIKKLSPSGVIQIIESKISASYILVTIQQPVSNTDEEKIREKLIEVKDSGFTVRMLGSIKHQQWDMMNQTQLSLKVSTE